MANSTRIKFNKVVKPLLPIIIGFLVLTIVALTITSYITTKSQKEEELLNSKRNQYIERYNHEISEFNAVKEAVMKLSIYSPQTAHSTYMEQLGLFSIINTELQYISNEILILTYDIKSFDEREREMARERVSLHLSYNGFVSSLEGYYQLISDASNVKKCFDEIPLKATDVKIKAEITECRNTAKSLEQYIDKNITGFSEYWREYYNYWDIVYNIHNKPSSEKIKTLQRELKTSFNRLVQLEKLYLEGVEKEYKTNLIPKT